MGDLGDVATLRDYRRNLRLYRELFDFAPRVVAVDKHPNYHTSRVGRELAGEDGLRLLEVQHHHAHIAACMAEHGLPIDTPKVLGVALDGLGYGEDGTLWGGEFLLADYHGCERLMHFQPVPMPGGSQAVREPWRNTFAHLATCIGWDTVRVKFGDLDIIRFLEGKPLTTLRIITDKGINSPLATSAGRLFDAVAATLGVCRDYAAYEGQAAVELEALATREIEAQEGRGYGYDIGPAYLGWATLWNDLLRDLAAGEPIAVLAARFHHGIAGAISDTVHRLCDCHDTETVVIGGGVFQNRLLLEQVQRRLHAYDLRVLIPRIIPANDGGVAFGQLSVAKAHDTASS